MPSASPDTNLSEQGPDQKKNACQARLLFTTAEKLMKAEDATGSLDFYNRLGLATELEDTARYAGLLLAPAEGFGLRPRLFLPFGQKKSLLCCFGPFLAFFGVQ